MNPMLMMLGYSAATYFATELVKRISEKGVNHKFNKKIIPAIAAIVGASGTQIPGMEHVFSNVANNPELGGLAGLMATGLHQIVKE